MMLFLWILIQILGESLPISSSSHVQLMQKLLDFFGVSYELFADFATIDFLLHGPTILILLFYFFTTWWSLVFYPSIHSSFALQMKNTRGERKSEEEWNKQAARPECFAQQKVSKDGWCKQWKFYKLFRPMLFVLFADVITFGFWSCDVAHSAWVQTYFLPIGLCLTAFCLFVSRKQSLDKKITWSLRDASVLGFVQGVSLMPGISRFASTYAAAIWLGYGRMQSFAISFLIQFPLLCAGFAKGLFALYHRPQLASMLMQCWVLSMIMIVSLISYRLLCWVAMLIRQNKLWYFAFYMIIPIIVSIAL